MSRNFNLLLQQIRVIDPVAEKDFIADVLIIDGKVQIATQINSYPDLTKIIEGKNLILGTGLIDLYSHSGEPGYEARETLFSLAASGGAGGFKEVAVLPDTIPAIDNLETINALKQKATQLEETADLSLSKLNFWVNLALERETPQMSELAQLSSYAVGFTQKLDFGNLSLFRQALEYLKPLQKPIAVDISANQLTNSGTVREGIQSLRYGLIGNPGYAEASAIAAVVEIVASINTPVHIMGVSTARGVEIIADAKQRGVPITASTTWMHLLFSTKDQSTYNPNLRLEPPLGNPHDLKALQQGIQEGIIDIIAIAHQAYTYEEKTVPFALAPPGAIGLQIALPILWQKLVATKIISPIQLWKALSKHPSIYLGIEPISIKNDISDLVLLDNKKQWLIDANSMHSLAANTPWWNREIIGQVIPFSSIIEH